jgi:hypothetical protein
MQNAVTCPCCGLEEPVADGGSTALEEIGEFSCEGCHARVVHGKVMPFVVVEPMKGPGGYLWQRVRIQDPKTRADLHVLECDPNLAIGLARNLLSLGSI